MSMEQRYVLGGKALSDMALAFRSGMVIWKEVCNGDHTECIIHTTIFLANSLAVTWLPIVSQSLDEREHTIMNVDWSTTDVRSFLKVPILQHRRLEQSKSFTEFNVTFCFKDVVPSFADVMCVSLPIFVITGVPCSKRHIILYRIVHLFRARPVLCASCLRISILQGLICDEFKIGRWLVDGNEGSLGAR